MNSKKAGYNTSFKTELTGHKRQQKALREFKEVLEDLVLMLRKATGTETVYLYWINRARQQFVMETKSTSKSEVVFQDRVGFDEHFLNEYRDIRQPVALELGTDLEREAITHYYHEPPVGHITLLPFINNDETVAITVVESAGDAFGPEKSDIIHAYINALGNVLNTYLEISDLYESQNEWVNYEESLTFLDKKGHHAALLADMLNTVQGLLEEGGVSLVARGMGTWTNVMNATRAQNPVPVGMAVEQRSLANDALNSGQAEFAIHFNRNPKRISPREVYTEGATMAVPLMFNDYRKGVVLVYDKNPLVFKESTKHKIANIVRLTALKIQARFKDGTDGPILSNEHDAFIPDLWERTIDMQIERLKENETYFHSWVAMISLSALSQIRTQLRLEELNLMQRDLVRAINPTQFGVPGFIGYHSDYIYTAFLQSRDEQAVGHWTNELRQKFSTPFELSNGKEIRTGLHIGFKELHAESGDSYRVITEVKRAFSREANAS